MRKEHTLRIPKRVGHHAIISDKAIKNMMGTEIELGNENGKKVMTTVTSVWSCADWYGLILEENE